MRSRSTTLLALAFAFWLTGAATALAQRGYGVNSSGLLFHFDVNTPANVSNVGSLPFVPEGIDFRPGTGTLYALDVGPNTTQVYTIDVETAQATPVGAGFNSTGSNYNLTANQTYGFDFNPTTLQPDDSMRIRVVGTSGTNLRLNSATGQIAGVDTTLAFVNTGASGFVDAAAYINNLPTAGGPTALYVMDSRNDALLLQNPPNAGTLNSIGQFGATVDALQNIGFDIFTPLNSVDTTLADDRTYAVLMRPDAPINGPLGAYLLYNVNLTTGQITNGALVGPSEAPYSFEGGFAINPVPEPGTLMLFGMAVATTGLMLRMRRK